MNRILEEYDAIWAVAYALPDESYRLTVEYFSDKDAADKFAKTLSSNEAPTVSQTTLWHDRKPPSERTWYSFSTVLPSEVMVDRITVRDKAIRKLTWEERRALGFT